MAARRTAWRGRLARRVLVPLLVLLGCAGVPYFAFLVKGLREDLREYVSRAPFESAVWKDPQWSQPGDSKDPLRLRMVDDLLGRYHLVGMSKAEVDELLGAPTEMCPLAGYDYAYWLRPERGLASTDSEWLVLKFQQDRVAEARAVVH